MSAEAKVSLLSTDPELVWEDKRAKSLSFFCRPQPPVLAGAQLISDLKRISADRDNCDVRVCLHNDHTDPQHDMVIPQHRERYSRPHKHLQNGEVQHVIEGRVAVALFDENGRITAANVLGRSDIYRMGLDIYHAVIPISPELIFHESRPGPFLGDAETVYPDWAPDGSDAEAGAIYMEQVFTTLRTEMGIEIE